MHHSKNNMQKQLHFLLHAIMMKNPKMDSSTIWFAVEHSYFYLR